MRLALGIDAGGTRTKIGLVSLDGGEVLDARIVASQTRDERAFLDSLREACRELTRDRESSPLGVGIGVPGYTFEGVVDSTWGFFAFMEDYPLSAKLGQALQLPCVIDNDARLVAMGEARYGAGRGFGRVLLLTIGTGLGLGFVADGRFPDASPLSHMAGHLTIRESGEVCYCGRQGCLELSVSATGLAEAGVLALGAPELDARAIFSLAQNGNLQARAVIDGFLRDLATGLDSYINLLAPDVIVLGGGVAHGLEPYLELLRAQLRARPFKRYSVEVLLAQHHEDAGILGGAALFD